MSLLVTKLTRKRLQYAMKVSLKAYNVSACYH